MQEKIIIFPFWEEWIKLSLTASLHEVQLLIRGRGKQPGSTIHAFPHHPQSWNWLPNGRESALLKGPCRGPILCPVSSPPNPNTTDKNTANQKAGLWLLIWLKTNTHPHTTTTKRKNEWKKRELSLADSFSWKFRLINTIKLFNFESLRWNETMRSSWGYEVMGQQWLRASRAIHLVERASQHTNREAEASWEKKKSSQ